MKELYLQEVRKVDKHQGARPFLTARHIKADRDNIHRLSSFGEFVFHSEAVKPARRHRYRFGKM